MEMVIQALEKFNRNISWRVYFKLNPQAKSNEKETYGFNSSRAPPRLKELKDWGKDLVKLVQSIKFRKRSNPFLTTLKNEIEKISEQKDLIIPADKTTNKYLVPPNQYMKMLEKEIQKSYKKEASENVKKVNVEHANAAKELEISDRMFATTPREAFITLKDHKEDFATNPKVRLINPCKAEIGRVAKQILDNLVKEIKSRNSQLNQATNTKSVLNWFKSIKNKSIYKFILFDIESFYPSITKELLEEALTWACQHINVTEQQKKIIMQASKTFLYSKGEPWVKKGETNFDISMGAFHGAQACEIVGLFILSKLMKLPNFQAILYRDDGLGITSSTPRQTEKLRQAIIKVFKDHNLNITIEVGLTRVNFLDVTLDLARGNYKPYRKPGDKPLYVSSWSNHPPRVIENIPIGINRRLCEISSNKDVFLEAIPPYQAELDKCGYEHQLTWMDMEETQQKKRKCRTRRITWFNPPFSVNIKTNVGKEFLLLLDKHFPKGHFLHSTLNRNTVKVSYSCLPNMGRRLAKHNSKVISKNQNQTTKPKSTCNCQISKKVECPVPGACNQDGAIYEATVKTSDGGVESYVGLAKNFKKRYGKHKATINDRSADGQTTLSKYIWRKKDEGLNPEVSWKYLETNIPDFNPITGKCKLCTREKFQIVLNPEVATLNSKTEIFSSCRHRPQYLIGEPPD